MFPIKIQAKLLQIKGMCNIIKAPKNMSYSVMVTISEKLKYNIWYETSHTGLRPTGKGLWSRVEVNQCFLNMTCFLNKART